MEDQPDVSRLVKVAAKYGIEIPVHIAVPKTSSCLSAMPLSGLMVVVEEDLTHPARIGG